MSAQDKYSLQERGRFKAWWDAARPLEGSAFPYEIAWAAWQAALSAQPSPGGQGDALATLSAGWRASADQHDENAREADSIGDMTATVQYLETKSEVLRKVAAELEAALAARQPVEFERAIPTRRRESAVELLLQLGFVWNNQRWEDRRQPVGEQ